MEDADEVHLTDHSYGRHPSSDAKQISVCKEEWSPSPDKEEPELPHIKVEQEELWTSQEGEQLQGLNETDIKITNIVSIKSEDYKETPSPQSVSSDQSETKTEDRDDDWKEPGLNTLMTKEIWRMEDAKKLSGFKEEWSTSLDQEEPELSYIKVEQEELWTSQEGEQLQGLNETDIKIINIVSIKRESDYKEEPSPQPVSSDQREIKTEDRDDDDWKEPGLNTLKTEERWRMEGSLSVTAGVDRGFQSSAVPQPITTSGSKPNRARSHCCHQCGKSFRSWSHLQTHQRVHTGEKPYNCQQCGKSFSDLSNLRRHQRVHTEEKPYHCQQCGKSFSMLSNLQTHQHVHTGAKHYCQQCDKSFTRLSNLQTHQRVHTGEKPYHCKQCDKSFSRLANLQTHQRVHTGEKPYHCQQCGKSFSWLPDLQSHKRIHTGEKPFHCRKCEKSFSVSTSLHRHQRVHTGEKPYHCQQCGKSFRQLSNLKGHKHVHTGEKPYLCQQCGKIFAKLSTLKRHRCPHFILVTTRSA